MTVIEVFMILEARFVEVNTISKLMSPLHNMQRIWLGVMGLDLILSTYLFKLLGDTV